MEIFRLNGELWIICGGRDFNDSAMFNDAMYEIIHLRGCPNRVIAGGARGVDKLAFEWVTRLAIPSFEVYADWNTRDKAPATIRYQNMLERRPQAVIAFPGGRGIADMVARARRAGVDVIEVQTKGMGR